MTGDGQRILVERAKQGDQDAFETLFLQHSGRIYSIAYRMCGNDADAQDVTQEAMIKAWNALGRFKFQSEFGTWLYRIAINAAKDHLRRAKKRPLSADALEDEGWEPSQGGFEAASDTRQDVRRALNALNPEHQQILVLRDMEGFSYEEIAAMLKLPIGTVRSRINRARGQLKKAYLGQMDARN